MPDRSDYELPGHPPAPGPVPPWPLTPGQEGEVIAAMQGEGTPRPADPPAEAVAAFCRTFWGAHPAELVPGLVEQAHKTVAAVLASARRAWFAELFGTPEPAADDGLPVDAVRLCSTARPGEHEQRTRAQVAADLKRAAAGRRDYATRAPEDTAAELEAEARVFDTASRVATQPSEVMWGLLPADMWTDADRPTGRREPW